MRRIAEMAIHHSQVKKAEKMGCTISEEGDNTAVFWPKRALKINGSSGSDALAQMQAAQVLVDGGQYRLLANSNAPRLVLVQRESDGLYLKGGLTTPVAAHKAIVLNGGGEWDRGEVAIDKPEDPLQDEVTEELAPAPEQPKA